MKYTLKPINQITCDELGAEVGIKITMIERTHDGSIHIHTDETEKDLSVADTAKSLTTISGMKLQDIKTADDVSVKDSILKVE